MYLPNYIGTGVIHVHCMIIMLDSEATHSRGIPSHNDYFLVWLCIVAYSIKVISVVHFCSSLMLLMPKYYRWDLCWHSSHMTLKDKLNSCHF